MHGEGWEYTVTGSRQQLSGGPEARISVRRAAVSYAGRLVLDAKAAEIDKTEVKNQ